MTCKWKEEIKIVCKIRKIDIDAVVYPAIIGYESFKVGNDKETNLVSFQLGGVQKAFKHLVRVLPLRLPEKNLFG